ncbi:MAG: AsmA-like C-terminal region-containing protein [Candidatus Acidiferrales bacterium]
MSKRMWILGGVALTALSVLLTLGALYFARGPIRTLIRHRTEAYLSARFQSQVRFRSFDVSLRHGLDMDVTVNQLTLRYRGRTDLPPLIEIRSASFEASFIGILRKKIHVRRVQLEGLQIHTPPRQPGAERAESGTDEELAKKYPVVIDAIVADDAVLEPLPKDPSHTPRPFFIHHVEMHDFQFDRPAQFEAQLTNPVPRGEIACVGQFGPWHAEDPSTTPVTGQFTFEHADLGTLKGVSGTLSSRGNFTGPLDELQVDGETDTPNFAVRTSSAPVDLHTKYSAIVDGTNGDVILKKVTATFLGTTLIVRGRVVDLTPQKGRTIELDAVAQKAPVQDLLQLAAHTEKPVMTGDARLHVKIDIPEKNEDLIERMRLDGRFHVGDVVFTNHKIQGRINTLSHKAQGDPQLGSKGREESKVRGTFSMKNGVLHFARLNFGVEGAAMSAAGTYSMDTGQLDFRGKLRLEASLSQTTTGMKSLFLKVVDPFFRGKNGGAVLPIKITGTKDQPKYGLDLFDSHKEKSAAPAAADAKSEGGAVLDAATSAEAAR